MKLKNKKNILITVVLVLVAVFVLLVLLGHVDFNRELVENNGDSFPVNQETGEIIENPLFMEIVEEGVGTELTENDVAIVEYTAIFQNTGELFYSTVGDDPVEISLNEGGFIEGLELSLLGMKKGGKRMVVVPSDYAYGENGVEGLVPPKATMVFFLELIDIK